MTSENAPYRRHRRAILLRDSRNLFLGGAYVMPDTIVDKVEALIASE